MISRRSHFTMPISACTGGNSEVYLPYAKTEKDKENHMSDHEMDPTGGIELTDAELGEVLGGVQSGASTGCNTKTCTRGNSGNPCTGCQS
jgi:hypothetical protein